MFNIILFSLIFNDMIQRYIDITHSSLKYNFFRFIMIIQNK